MRLFFGLRIFLIFCASVAAFGCGGGPRRPVVQYVEGVVTLDGEPVDSANVTFVPQVAGEGLVASGLTDAQGRYRLSSLGGGLVGAGASAGVYDVTIEKVVDIRPPPTESEAGGGRARPPRPEDFLRVVPEPYGNASTSGISVIVRKGRNRGREFDFHLSSGFTGVAASRE